MARHTLAAHSPTGTLDKMTVLLGSMGEGTKAG